MKKRNILSVKHKNIIIFGGCGLLGSEFAKHLFYQNNICIRLNKKNSITILKKN